MSKALTKAIDRSNSIATAAFESAMQLKAGAVDFTSAGGVTSSVAGWQEQARYGQHYDLLKGWVYSAVNVLSSEGAGQPPVVMRLKGSTVRDNEEKRRVREKAAFMLSKMPASVKTVSADYELEILEEHWIKELLMRPNPIQDKWQFVYSFIANLCMTGWSYVVLGKHKDETELYCLPTTWVRPVHDPTPFAYFDVKNPKAVGVEPDRLDRSQVGFAHLPNPSDPLTALAPASSQLSAIRIDDHIQTSQELFFRNGIFPSVVLTVGKIPFLDTEGRPVLTGTQRRALIGAVKKLQGGVANYGEPMIVDGMIESVERLTATQNEMGWEKSEEKIRTRILSAYAVHPYILGENVSVGGYAQVANIEKRFYKRVNTLLDMLGNLLTNLLGSTEDEKLLIGYECVEVVDPQLRNTQVQTMRKNGDISRNEVRAEGGFPPVEEETSDRSQLLETVGGMNGTVAIMTALGQGAMSRESAAKMLEIFLQVSKEEALEIVGPEPPEPPVPSEAPPEAPGGPQKPVSEEEGEDIGKALEELRETRRAFEKMMAPMELADDILEKVKCQH